MNRVGNREVLNKQGFPGKTGMVGNYEDDLLNYTEYSSSSKYCHGRVSIHQIVIE